MAIVLITAGLILVMLKLASAIAWSWLVVLIPFVACVLMWLIKIVINALTAFFHNKQRRKFIKSFVPEQREFAEHLWDSDN
jgi:uncharacterized protein YacL